MAKNPIDKFNKRLKRAEGIRDYVNEQLEQAGIKLTDSNFISMDNLKELTEEETKAFINNLEDLIPKRNNDFVYKYTEDMFLEILLDYYEFESEDGVVMDTNKGRLGMNPNFTKNFSDKERRDIERTLRGEYDPASDTYSGGLGSAFRNKSKGYDARTMELLQHMRNKMGRRH